eukprot:CAMPEP_0198731870 /NCGR_PEP_ID=MMETSP1475-20131203/32565_1 /TAXON_ID= ORGANISM="Unidentified sp., Strain CCMP1999" /NCGR_SAMPLE_ID=MMETSP1475 /ASSEMBLY_ACC=CAM_ASM_001111 /LENGTH=322 /DNA_ID=CAMNT_0044494885 /DNA_START=128 /DNA_END=1096 /DNA_ORIENTATION=+
MGDGDGIVMITGRCDDSGGLGSLLTCENKSTSRFSARMRDIFGRCSASAKGDIWRSLMLKATTRACEPPSAKILKTIVSGVNYFGCDVVSAQSAPRIVFEVVKQRLLERDWVVVLKALTCLHHILRETANQSFVDLVLAEYVTLLDMSRFSEPNAKASQYRPFIVSYGRYLSAHCAAREKIQYPPVKNNLLDPYANYEKFFHQRFETVESCEREGAVLPLFSLLRALFNIPFSDVSNLKLAESAVDMLAKDFFHIWNSFQTCMSCGCRIAPELTWSCNKEIYDGYDAFCKEAKLVIEEIEDCVGPYRRPKIRCKIDLISMQY